jgi:hypothetical protein
MSEPEFVDVQPRRGRWFVGCAGAIVALLILLVGQYAYFRYLADRHLREVTAKLDASDPGWRLADIEFNREQIPDAQNAAFVVLTARAALPRLGFPPPELEVPGKGVEPPQRMRDDTAARVEAELAKYPEAVAKARTLADYDRGRYPIRYTADVISTLLPHLQEAREVAVLLQWDAADRGQEKDVDGALRSARSAAVCGRSIGDEPFMVSHLVRIACFAIASNAVERALNHGEASDAELIAVQTLWLKEDGENLLHQMTRGERACVNETAGLLHSGKMAMSQLTGNGQPTTAEKLATIGQRNWFRHEHARMLELTTRQIEIAKLLPHEQVAPLDELENEVKAMPSGLAKVLMPAMMKVAQAAHRHRGTLRSVAVLVAAERYRKVKGHWPETASELVPAYLPEVPLDPYDGKPIRLKRGEFGITVYCVGPDRKDDGGTIDREARQKPGTDAGYQLWDVDKRHQPAPPRPPDDKVGVAPPALPPPEPPQ